MAERKLVVVTDTGILHELGGIGGPICAPTRIPIPTILKMINNQRHVYECNPLDPRNPEMRVRLTQENYKSNNFGKSQPVVTEEDKPVTQTVAPEKTVTKQVADTEPEKEPEKEAEKEPETEVEGEKTETPVTTQKTDEDVKTESEDHTNDEDQGEVKDETPTDQAPVSETSSDKKPVTQAAKTTKSSKKKK